MTIIRLQGTDIIMLFNVKKEAYISGRGSMATEFLPDAIRQDKVKEGQKYIKYSQYNMSQRHNL